VTTGRCLRRRASPVSVSVSSAAYTSSVSRRLKKALCVGNDEYLGAMGGARGVAGGGGLPPVPELSVGPFSVTRPNPTHQLSDPTQPNATRHN